MTEAVRRTRKAQTTLAGVSILGALGAATAIGVSTHTTSSSSPDGNGGHARAQRLSQGGGFRGDDGGGDDGGRDDGRLLSAPRQGSGQVQQAPQQAPLPAPHAQSSGS